MRLRDPYFDGPDDPVVYDERYAGLLVRAFITITVVFMWVPEYWSGPAMALAATYVIWLDVRGR